MNAMRYHDDFFLWTQQQAALLRQGQLNALDAANLAEEIESIGKRDRRALTSHLANLLLHLLKWTYQPERRGTSWRLSIRNARQEIRVVPHFFVLKISYLLSFQRSWMRDFDAKLNYDHFPLDLRVQNPFISMT